MVLCRDAWRASGGRRKDVSELSDGGDGDIGRYVYCTGMVL
jgi:hypothetical protein